MKNMSHIKEHNRPGWAKLARRDREAPLSKKSGLGQTGPKAQGSAAFKKARAWPNWPEGPGKRKNWLQKKSHFTLTNEIIAQHITYKYPMGVIIRDAFFARSIKLHIIHVASLE